MDDFVCGQRWVSLSEPGLGLGLVLQVDPRQVQVLFPADAEIRTYASDNAPLKRLRVAVGDSVSDQSGISFVVESVKEENGLLVYLGEGLSLPEASLADNLCAGGPEARLLAGHVDSSSLFDLRLKTLEHGHNSRRSVLRGYTGARIELLPHQLYIAHEVSCRQNPRVLLADEVGLGKTIEACLILHRMIVCGRAQRILVILPDALLHQWFVELLRRFNLAFRIVDKHYCNAAKETGIENPFLEEQFVLCGLDFMVENRIQTQQALTAGWDVVVVDEAHHLRWSEESPSVEYCIVEAFASSVAGILLLTASPEQTGLESHFARLRLLDPHRYSDFKRFLAEHDQYVEIAKQAASIIEQGTDDELQVMLDRYGPGRVMFRNSRKSMSGFSKRIPHLVGLDRGDESESETRALWLVDFLRKNPAKKVLVICATANDVMELESLIRSKLGVDITSFHEELTLLQCDRQAAWFAEPEGAKVLITSGIGGEGRNYQFASHMVLMDIPNDPELIEQRIGRLDRIGQANNIHIHVPYVCGSIMEGRVRWLHEGLDAFSAPLVGGYQMYLKFGDRLNLVTDALIAETRQAHDDLCRRIEAGRNLLLELSSCRLDIANKLVNAIEKEESDPALEKYMVEVFDQFGVDAEPLDGRDYLLSADLLFCEEFPLPRERGAMQVTFDRTHALSRPTITLLSWDHPMVQGAIDLILGSERGSCSIARSSIDGVVLQAIYVLEVVSSKRLDIEQYLPPTPIVVQVNSSLEQVTGKLIIDGDAEPWQLRDNIQLRQEIFPAMVSASREIAKSKAPVICKRAELVMRKKLTAEIMRMNDLKKVNDHIRQEEIDLTETQILDFAEAIQHARLRLDAIRLVM